MLTEIRKLTVIRAIGLPPGLFADVAPKVMSGWREREVTDSLVDLLIATVHRNGARAERKVTEELINAFRRVTGKERSALTWARASGSEART